MNGISDDVLQSIVEMVIVCGSKRLGLRGDMSHWLDILSASNSSNRNGNDWLVTMIVSLNIMVKLFVEIAKSFVGLSATIVAIKRRHVFALHLEAKYAKTDSKKDIYMKN